MSVDVTDVWFHYRTEMFDGSFLPSSWPCSKDVEGDGDGKPMIPDGDPESLLLRLLWGNVSINPSKANHEKEFMRAEKCLEK
jgi:hypothetical protein